MYAKTLAGRYRLDSIHKESDLSIVYRGWDESSRLPVAVKELKLSRFSEDDAKHILQVFIREIKYLKDLNSPVFPKYYDLLTQGKKCYLIMEWLEGKDLQLLLKDGALTPEDKALSYFESIAKTLMKLQDREVAILHKGLKPNDIIVDEEGKVRLLDFCSSRIVEAMNEIHIGSMKTSSYTAPEDLDENIEGDLSSDVYSLGSIIFHMVTGEDPGKFGGIIPSPKSLTPELTEKFSNLIVDCLKPRQSRIRDMKTLLTRISDAAPKVVEKKKVREPGPLESPIIGTIYFFVSLALLGAAYYLYQNDISFLGAVIITTLTGPFTIVYILYKFERLLKTLITRQKQYMNAMTLYGISGFATLIGVIAAVVLITSTSAVQEAKDTVLFTGCSNNLKSISIALEAYAEDNKDKGYPKSLKELIPKYLDKVPKCPAVHRDTYSKTYQSSDSGKFRICCEGNNHEKIVGSKGNWPQYTQNGLIQRPGDDDIFKKAVEKSQKKIEPSSVKASPSSQKPGTK